MTYLLNTKKNNIKSNRTPCQFCGRKYVDIEAHEESCKKNPLVDKVALERGIALKETELLETTKVFMAYYKQQIRSVINQKTCYILYAKITGKDLLEEMDKIKKILEEKKNE